MFGRSIFGGILAYLASLYLLLPLLAVVPFSFTAKRYLSLPGGDWSLRHYATIFESDVWLKSIGASVGVAIGASTLATLLATAFGLGLWYLRPRLAKLFVGMALLPMVVPPVTSAVILYFCLARIGLLDSITGLIIGHTVMIVPFAVVAILSALTRLNRDIELAARNLGANIWQTTVWVILPNLKFGIFSAWFLSLILSWEEATVTLFVSGVNVITLPKRMWDNLRLDVDPVIAAISVVMILLTTLLILLKKPTGQSDPH